MRLIIGGDLLPQAINEEAFAKSEISFLVSPELASLCSSADLFFCNLEGPLTKEKVPIGKSGPALKTLPETAKGIHALGISCVGLANNHSMDYGPAGLASTQQALNDAGISSVGAGADLSDARKPFLFSKDGICVGVYACAEHEFSIAEADRPGANPYDENQTIEDIKALKAKTDYVVVLYHGGKEYYRYPAPYLQARCRAMATAGANLVLCQHSHCIGAKETYAGAEILYGQGNFLLNRGPENEFRHSGLLAQVDLDEGSAATVKYLPVIRRGMGVAFPDAGEKDAIEKAFYERSQKIVDPAFVRAEYTRFAEQKAEELYSILHPECFWDKVRKKLHLPAKSLRKCFSKRERYKLLNLLQCEAHRDLFLCVLRGESEGEEKR